MSEIEHKPLHRQTLSLPSDLQDAIATALKAVPTIRWMRAAQALSERYRAERVADTPPLASGADHALGYVALLMPATYAQLRGAMAAMAARCAGWQPQTVLDLGSGPGTALWAALAQWPTLHALTAYEREPAFITLGRALAERSASPALRAARWQHSDLVRLASNHPQPRGATRRERDKRKGDPNHGDEEVIFEDLGDDEPDERQVPSANQRPTTIKRAEAPHRAHRAPHTTQYDLVIIGHVLNELGAATQAQLVAEAWRRTAGALLIVEPGTSAAFAVVRAARDSLLAQGAHTLAPCVHDQPCPLANDFCHFPQRLKRPDFQRRARGAPSEWEDAKFSYAAMARFSPDSALAGRVIREPEWNKGYAEALISAQAGIVRHRVFKRERDQFRAVKELRWGDALADDEVSE